MPQITAANSPAAIQIVDGMVLSPTEERLAPVRIDGQLIGSVGGADEPGKKWSSLDASGCYVTPGLIDLQVNGGPECDLWGDPDGVSLHNLRATMARCGVTSFLPTLITDDIKHLQINIARLKAAGVDEEGARIAALEAGKLVPGMTAGGGRDVPVARMLGIHLEGPFLSPEKPGVHPRQWVKPLEPAAVAELVDQAVRLITLAPEQEESGQSIQLLREKGVRLSIGHSNASFEQARTAFESGVSLMTHTFNALPALHHRQPGAVAAALLDPRVYCCVIADGLHVDRAIVELLVKIKGPERTILVTDRAHVGTGSGGLVGSSLTLDQAVRNLVNWGVASFREAILMATVNPAKALGLDNCLGELEPGKLADLVLWDTASLAVKHVVVGGKLVF